MPELPEVETARRSFAGRIHGARVTGVRLGKPLRWPLGCPAESLIGQAVGAVTRRGKYLWLPLSSGGLLMHPGKSGSRSITSEAATHGLHDRSAPVRCGRLGRGRGA